MGGNVSFYYAIWVLYLVGYLFSGPIPHQVIISQWFKRHRGKAMAAASENRRRETITLPREPRRVCHQCR